MTRISCSWSTGSGRETADAEFGAGLAKLVSARAKELGETTAQAVTATSIRALTSFRALTPVAKKKPQVFPFRWRILIENTPYISGWASPPLKAKHGRRVVRSSAGGHAIDALNSSVNQIGGNPKRIINCAGDYARTKSRKVSLYRARMYHDENESPAYDWYILALSQGDVKKYAEKKIGERIRQYRGVSKTLLGIAMHKISKGGNSPSSCASDVRKLAEDGAIVNITEHGVNSGEVGVSFVDVLPQSAASLKGGSSAVKTVLEKTSNATANVIARKTMRPLDEVKSSIGFLTCYQNRA